MRILLIEVPHIDPAKPGTFIAYRTGPDGRSFPLSMAFKLGDTPAEVAANIEAFLTAPEPEPIPDPVVDPVPASGRIGAVTGA